MGKYAIEDCEHLEIINILNKGCTYGPYPERCPNLKYHLRDNVLFECFNPQNSTECILDGGIKSIEGYAFFISSFKSIILPEGLEKIDSDAFKECYDLEYISIPSTVKEIPAGTFSDGEALNRDCLKGWRDDVWQPDKEWDCVIRVKK